MDTRDIKHPRHVDAPSAEASTGSSSPPSERLEATAMLARNVAHDINNLMGIVLGGVALVRDDGLDATSRQTALRALEEAAGRAGHLAQRLLTFVDGANRPPEVLNLNGIVSHVLRYEEQTLAPRVRIKRYNAPDLWNVAADPNAVNEIVMNLCIRALESIQDEGRITLTTQNIELDAESAHALRGLKPGPQVLFSVEDSGGGLSHAEIAELFQSRGKGEQERRPRSLARVYRLVKDHQGHIAVRSEPGIGTTVDVYLPASSAAVGTKVRVEGEAPRGYETVLVIDDEQDVRGVIGEILESMGYHVIMAGNGREAIETAETFDGAIHLALLDMAMPEMGGAEAYPRLKMIRPEMKVVIMSGFDLGVLGAPLREAGVNGLLQKPFKRGVLARAIRDALDAESAMSAPPAHA